MGGENGYFKCNSNFTFLTDFKLLNQMKVNPISDCDFLKFIVCIRGVHCDYSLCLPKNLAMPLDVNMPFIISSAEHTSQVYTVSF